MNTAYLIIIGLVAWCAIFSHCKNHEDCQQIKKPNGFVDSLQSYYSRYLETDSVGVVEVTVESLSKDTTIMTISSTVFNNVEGIAMFEWVNNRFPVVYYSVSCPHGNPNLNLEKIRTDIRPWTFNFLEDKDGFVIETPPNYNPETWQLTVVSSRIVNTSVVN